MFHRDLLHVQCVHYAHNNTHTCTCTCIGFELTKKRKEGERGGKAQKQIK